MVPSAKLAMCSAPLHHEAVIAAAPSMSQPSERFSRARRSSAAMKRGCGSFFSQPMPRTMSTTAKAHGTRRAVLPWRNAATLSPAAPQSMPAMASEMKREA